MGPAQLLQCFGGEEGGSGEAGRVVLLAGWSSGNSRGGWEGCPSPPCHLAASLAIVLFSGLEPLVSPSLSVSSPPRDHPLCKQPQGLPASTPLLRCFVVGGGAHAVGLRPLHTRSPLPQWCQLEVSSCRGRIAPIGEPSTGPTGLPAWPLPSSVWSLYCEGQAGPLRRALQQPGLAQEGI